LGIIYKSNEEEAKRRKLGFGYTERLNQKRSASAFNLMKDRVSKEKRASALFSEMRMENVP
jgi:hypothetical protein